MPVQSQPSSSSSSPSEKDAASFFSRALSWLRPHSVVVTDLDNSVGAYHNEPGADPVIIINERITRDSELYKLVLTTLQQYHQSIQADSWERVRKFTVFFEELIQQNEPAQSQGQALASKRVFMTARQWTRLTPYRLIG